MLILPSVYPKPHAPTSHQKDIVQIEKQEIREINAEEENTRNILNKIQQFNQNRGLLGPKKPPSVQRLDVAKQQQFQFPPFGQFSNPIFEYLHNTQHDDRDQSHVKNAAVNPEDEVTGQYIKRKITHQQSMVIPGPSIIHLYNNDASNYLPPLGFAKEAPPPPPPEDSSQTVENVRNIMSNQMHFPYTNPYGYPQNEVMFRQGFWQSPLSQYFPIVIKDPIQQMMNAVTSMVEYGPPPSVAAQGACAEVSKCSENNNKDCQLQASKQLEIEDLELTNNKEQPLKFTVKINSRDESPRLVKEKKPLNSSRINNKLPAIAQALGITSTTEDTKAGGLFSREPIKEYSQDNMGNGIFLHKLRVREGGVAIAGPGGIATAGHGGTAIVGPDGYAYTQPDSLAIAGSGTKVIAVNPGVDLSQLVKNISKNNTELNSRIGRVVAVGPVTNISVIFRRWVVAPLHLQLPHQPSLNLNPSSQSSNDKLQNLLFSHILSKTSRNMSQQVTDDKVDKQLLVRNSNDVLTPYKAHPLFYNLKNFENGRVISIRNNDGEETETATMILKPVAKAVAGQEGTAIATPLSTALVRQGTNVDILYEPEAVAIAGPGGIAHAQSDLEIFYEEIVR
ncbi:hypothetical protein FQR65_LT04642 [Abscondita terminalis]|nr:hypothetical protein FQR65_LT04642 [Abscondita terminalis]